MEFWVLGAGGTKDSTNDIGRTCWTQLLSCAKGRKKNSWFKKSDTS